MMDRVIAAKLFKQAIEEGASDPNRDFTWTIMRLVDMVAEHEREKCAKILQRRIERVLGNVKDEVDDCLSLIRGEK